MMKLTPERVDVPAGTIVTFTCSYHSSEKMEIVFDETFYGQQNIGHTPGTWLQRIHNWGGEGLWRVTIKPQHTMVSCLVRNTGGTVVGTLSSMIHLSLIHI